MQPNAEEGELMRRAMHDPAQFAPLYERYFDRVYAYCRRRTASAQEAEDVCSQVFARALAGVSGYRGGSVAAWIFQIAHHTLANHYRARRPLASLDEIEEVAAADAAENLEDADDHRTLAALVGQLSDEQRALLALAVDADLSSQQIGVILGKSAVAVRVQLHRTLQRLREQFRQKSREEYP